MKKKIEKRIQKIIFLAIHRIWPKFQMIYVWWFLHEKSLYFLCVCGCVCGSCIFCDSFTFKKRTKNVQKRWTRKVEYTLKCNSFTLKFFLHYSYENGLYLCRLDGYLKWKVCILIFEPWNEVGKKLVNETLSDGGHGKIAES